MQCPKCGSTEVEKRDHEKNLKTIGGILMTSAGATAGTVGGAQREHRPVRRLGQLPDH